MNAMERVARTRSQLRFAVITSAILWAATALIATLVAELLIGRWSRFEGLQSRGWSWNAAVIAAILAFGWIVWRGRFVLSARRVALWIEEHAPSLQYALVTASDPAVTGDTSMLRTAIERSNMDTLIRPAVLTPIIYSMVALSVTAGLFAIAITAVSQGRVSRAAAVVRDGPKAVMAGNRLIGIHARVTPPGYARAATTTLDDPSGITALVGSSVTLEGPGPSAGVGARMDDHVLRTGGRNSNWSVAFVMPAAATTVTLKDRSYERVIAIIPVVDEPPAVTMQRPSRDTVWRRVPSGSLTFVARATDDVGLMDGRFEYTVTTGGGEIFKSTAATFGSLRLADSRTSDFRATIDLGHLGLAPGAILSVRAIVSDNNTLTGPSVATSDTRTFRVARSDEYDSLAVDAAPPPPMEKSLLTERMLIISAESLYKQRATLGRAPFVASALRIGQDQSDLRKKVYAILYGQPEAGGDGGTEGDDEELDPQLVVNHDLKNGYDAMWDAERALNIGDIQVALPFMRRAAVALDKARLANRLYLRGRPPRIVVNIEKVRLSAKEHGKSSVVSDPRTPADSAMSRLDRSLQSALRLMDSDPQRLADGLIRLRAQAVSVNTTFASAIGDAADALRAGKDMTPALVRARRSLLGAPTVGNPSIPWTGSWGTIP